jgi:GntR family transcriptional regulator
LEKAGLVSKRHGSGTYISDAGSPLARKERMKILTERADSLVSEARNMNIPLDEAIDLVRQRHELLNQSKK